MPANPFKKNQGFTLIELLVVIAIIAILGGFLFPVIYNAKASAQLTQDISQLRQITQGMIMYVDNHENQSVPCKTESKPNGFAKKADDYAWPVHILSYVKSEEIFYSPADKRIKLVAQKSYNGPEPPCVYGFYTSWGYNSHYLSPKDEPLSMSIVSHPSSTILLANSTYYPNVNNKSKDYGYYRVSPPIRNYWKHLNQNFDKKTSYGLSYGHVWPRHHSNTSCNVSFVDGHVKTMSLDELKDLSLWEAEKKFFN